VIALHEVWVMFLCVSLGPGNGVLWTKAQQGGFFFGGDAVDTPDWHIISRIMGEDLIHY